MEEPYRDSTQPGRKDVNGIEWWACDPYPTWFRWEGANLRLDHAEWVPDDPAMMRRKAEQLKEKANKLYEEVLKLREQAQLCREAANVRR